MIMTYTRVKRALEEEIEKKQTSNKTIYKYVSATKKGNKNTSLNAKVNTRNLYSFL